jgi:subtilisin family serine protease
MDSRPTFDEILNNPDTLTFVFKTSEFFKNFLQDRLEVSVIHSIDDQYIIGAINKSYYERLREDLGTGITNALPFAMGLLDRISLESAGVIQVQNQPFLNLKGKGVLVGIVDTGIDYTKNAFINSDGNSKIIYLLDQTIPGTVVKENIFIGTEYTNDQINQALRAENPFDIVPSVDTVGHGTFLASVAAGNAEQNNTRNIGAAPEADLIVVKLAPMQGFLRDLYLIPPDQENVYNSHFVMLGIHYILDKAQQLNRPVAICLGLGTNMGGHEGGSLFEEYLSNVSRITGVCLCCAAGNESEARHHTQGTVIGQDQFTPINIRVGENAGDFFVSIWCSASDKMSVAVRSPTGESVSRVTAKAGARFEVKLILENSRVIVEYYFPSENSGSELILVKIFNATPGIWTIQVYGDIILSGTFHAYLPLTGLVSPNVEFLAPTPYYTVVVPATALGVITTGAYNQNTNTLYNKTSWGPTRLPMLSPDFVAPGADVGGVYPSGNGTMSGTSVSAAIATGACALLLQWGIIQNNNPSMNTYQARAYIIRGCTRDPSLTYPNYQWGYGRLNLFQTFNLMRE